MLSLVDFTFKHGFSHPYPVHVRVWVDGRQLWRSEDDGAPFLVGDTIREIGRQLNLWPFSEAGKRIYEAAKHYEREAAFLDLRMSAPEDLDAAIAAEKAFWELVWRLESDPASLEKGPGLARVEFLPIATEGVRHG